MIKESIIYLIRALNPVALLRNRAKQIQMLRQIVKYLRISLNPVAFERNRTKKMQEMQAKATALQAKVGGLQETIKELQGKIKELQAKNRALDAVINPLDFNTADSMNRYYSFYTEEIYTRKYPVFLEILTNYVQIGEAYRVLDAGCGLGVFTNLVKERFGVMDMHGFDFSSVAISHAKEKYTAIDFFVHDIYNPLSTKYDVIICTETLEHLVKPDTAVRNLTAALSDEGVLVLTVPDGDIDHCSRHINFWNQVNWELFISEVTDEAFYSTTGLAQHPTAKELRFNWAILRRQDQPDYRLM
jgi:2-polyprenyl-3-methyl-5-hydroxy-6-metoxy-1,4-benzoquinol methylase